MTDFPQATKQSIWLKKHTPLIVEVIDQRYLPHEYRIAQITSLSQTESAIREMWVRGAPLIGATAAYGVVFAVAESMNRPNADEELESKLKFLAKARPTAVNLQWAIDRQVKAISKAISWTYKLSIAYETAEEILQESIQNCYNIGKHGLSLIKEIANNRIGPVNILTHCNAGWLACVQWGTATSPIYHAHEAGIPVHVWVDETRPRNQGARLTAWELGQRGVPHTVIADNVGGHLMQHGKVDLCIVGADRITRQGDVANKIGTYLKALAAHDNQVPFYVALPYSTIDWTLKDGLTEIPIEERGAEEVSYIQGLSRNTGEIDQVRLIPADSEAINYGFDVTPARLVTGLITDRGICEANEKGLIDLFGELGHA